MCSIFVTDAFVSVRDAILLSNLTLCLIRSCCIQFYLFYFWFFMSQPIQHDMCGIDRSAQIVLVFAYALM